MTESLAERVHVTRKRVASLDGIRGAAIVLVMLSHGWVLWPIGIFNRDWLIRPLMRSGDPAVTVFLLISGYLTYRTLSGREGIASMRPAVSLLRRLIRVVPSLWTMLFILLAIAAIDPTDHARLSDELTSVGHVMTYTWNWYVQGNLLTSWSEMGHMWYLSVEMQAFLICSYLLFLMRRRPVGVLFLLSGFWVLLTWWRFHLTHTEFTLQILVRTTGRMDAFVLGVLVAAAMPFLAKLGLTAKEWSGVLAISLTILLVPLWWCAATPSGSGDQAFLRWGGTLLQLDLALVVIALTLGVQASRCRRALESRPLVYLGENSLLLYIWHYPIYVIVNRHMSGSPWPLKAAVAITVLAVVFVAADRLVERRVTRWLSSPRWRQLDEGMGPAITRQAATLASTARTALSQRRA